MQHTDHNGGNWAQNDKNPAFKKRLVASEPSAHVIFLGLDPDFTEADVCLTTSVISFSMTEAAPPQLQNYLTAHGGTLESVTIIRDRTTGT